MNIRSILIPILILIPIPVFVLILIVISILLSLALPLSSLSLFLSVMSHWRSFPRDARSILGNTFCQFPMLYKVSISLYEDRRPPWHTLDARGSILFENFYTLGSWGEKVWKKKRKERKRKEHFHIMRMTLIVASDRSIDKPSKKRRVLDWWEKTKRSSEWHCATIIYAALWKFRRGIKLLNQFSFRWVRAMRERLAS